MGSSRAPRGAPPPGAHGAPRLLPMPRPRRVGSSCPPPPRTPTPVFLKARRDTYRRPDPARATVSVAGSRPGAPRGVPNREPRGRGHCTTRLSAAGPVGYAPPEGPGVTRGAGRPSGAPVVPPSPLQVKTWWARRGVWTGAFSAPALRGCSALTSWRARQTAQSRPRLRLPRG